MSDRDFLRDSVTRVIAQTLTSADIFAAEDARVLPAKMSAALNDIGVLLMLAPEVCGGIGAGLPDAIVCLRVLGAAAAPGPWLETMLGQSLLCNAGLGPVNGGLTIAFVEDREGPDSGRSYWEAPPVLHDVPWGAVAENVLVVVRSVDAATLVLSASSDWSTKPGRDAAGEPRDCLAGKRIRVTSVADAHIGYDQALQTAALLRAGQMLGSIEWTLQRCAEYAMERQQFGRAIGKFQIVQQMIAELADHCLAASSITEAAAVGFGPTLVAAARSRLGDASDVAISVGHQVHGALGFSREYPLNLRTRRLMAWRDDYGTVSWWRQRLGRTFAGLTRDTLWPAVTDAGLPLESPKDRTGSDQLC